MQTIDDDHAARRRLGHLSVGTRSLYVHSARASGESRYASVRVCACGPLQNRRQREHSEKTQTASGTGCRASENAPQLSRQ